MTIGLSLLALALFTGAFFIHRAPADDPGDQDFRDNAAITFVLVGVLIVGMVLGLTMRVE